MNTDCIRNNHVGFKVAPVGHFAYQNASWLPDAVQAQEAILPEHGAEARAQQRQQ